MTAACEHGCLEGPQFCYDCWLADCDDVIEEEER